MNLALHVMVNTPGAQLMSPGHTFNLAYGHLKTKAKQDTNLFNHTMRNVCQMYVIESNNDHIITLVEWGTSLDDERITVHSPHMSYSVNIELHMRTLSLVNHKLIYHIYMVTIH